VKRRQFLQAPLALPFIASAQTRNAPNLLLILADDLGYGDPGCYGQRRIATPNLDRLAAAGLRFTGAYAGSAVCAPSRCSLLTGMHTGHCRIRGNRSAAGKRISLEREDFTLAELLRGAGYRTAAIGKWGVGEAETEGIPTRQGFHRWMGFLNQDHALHYFPQSLWRDTAEWFPGGNQGMQQGAYVQDLFVDEALRFLRENAAGPFFLYLPFTLPHADSERSRKTGDGYVVPDHGIYANEKWDSADRGYAAMVSRLDADLGRLLDELKRLKLEENTLVIFLSDNGPANEGRHRATFFESAGRVEGVRLRGHKGQLYEGGIRVPALMRWAGRIQPGTVCDTPWYFPDLMPTLAELAGLPAPSGLDGQSIVPLLGGGTFSRRNPMYWELAGRTPEQALRDGEWKLLRFGEGRELELYHLGRDPGETRNLAGDHPERATAMRAAMNDVRTPSPLYPLD
jgi:arylsulfatase A-like enzyme